MENREFIAAKDLPEIEAETVDVLCVNPETGEMGKKSGAALGGETKYDIVVRFTYSCDEEENNVTATAEILSGSYDAVIQKLDAGIMPLALMVERGMEWNGEIKAVDECVPSWRKYEDMEGLAMYGWFNLLLGSDGTVWVD